MPKTVKAPPGAEYQDNLTLPRDGEGIDAGDVNGPMGVLLGNDGWLYRVTTALAQRVEELERLQGGFVLLAPAAQTAEPGRSYPLSIGIGRIDGYTGTVALQALNLPVGVTAAFDPQMAAGNTAALTLTIGEDAVAGAYNVTMRGVGADGKISEALVKLAVAEATLQPTFYFLQSTLTGMGFAQAPGPVESSIPLPIIRAGGFAAPITFSITGLPVGMTATFAPNPATGSASQEYAASVMTLTATGTGIPAGRYSPIMRASGGGVVRTAPLELEVTAPAAQGQADFSLSVVYDSGNGLTGNGATVSLGRINGMTGPITLSLPPESGNPALLVNGQPWSAVVTSNTARITADGASRGWNNSGVATTEGVNPASLYLFGSSQLSGTATVNGVQVTRAVRVTYRYGTRSY